MPESHVVVDVLILSGRVSCAVSDAHNAVFDCFRGFSAGAFCVQFKVDFKLSVNVCDVSDGNGVDIQNVHAEGVAGYVVSFVGVTVSELFGRARNAVILNCVCPRYGIFSAFDGGRRGLLSKNFAHIRVKILSLAVFERQNALKSRHSVNEEAVSYGVDFGEREVCAVLSEFQRSQVNCVVDACRHVGGCGVHEVAAVIRHNVVVVSSVVKRKSQFSEVVVGCGYCSCLFVFGHIVPSNVRKIRRNFNHPFFSAVRIDNGDGVSDKCRVGESGAADFGVGFPRSRGFVQIEVSVAISDDLIEERLFFCGHIGKQRVGDFDFSGVHFLEACENVSFGAGVFDESVSAVFVQIFGVGVSFAAVNGNVTFTGNVCDNVFVGTVGIDGCISAVCGVVSNVGGFVFVNRSHFFQREFLIFAGVVVGSDFREAVRILCIFGSFCPKVSYGVVVAACDGFQLAAVVDDEAEFAWGFGSGIHLDELFAVGIFKDINVAAVAAVHISAGRFFVASLLINHVSVCVEFFGGFVNLAVEAQTPRVTARNAAAAVIAAQKELRRNDTDTQSNDDKNDRGNNSACA